MFGCSVRGSVTIPEIADLYIVSVPGARSRVFAAELCQGGIGQVTPAEVLTDELAHAALECELRRRPALMNQRTAIRGQPGLLQGTLRLISPRRDGRLQRHATPVSNDRPAYFLIPARASLGRVVSESELSVIRSPCSRMARNEVSGS